MSSRAVSVVAVIGRDLAALCVLACGLQAIGDAGLEAIGASEGSRNVELQFDLERVALQPAIAALAQARVEALRPPVVRPA